MQIGTHRSVGRVLMFALIFLIGCFKASGAAGIDACVALAQHVAYNTALQQGSTYSYGQYAHNFCSWYSSYHQSHLNANASELIPIGDIPVSLGQGLTNSEADGISSVLCQAEASLDISSSAYTNFSQYVASANAGIINNCINAEKGGLSPTAQIGPGDDFFDIELAYTSRVGGGTSTKLNYVRILPAGEFVCPHAAHETDLTSVVGQSLSSQVIGLACRRNVRAKPFLSGGRQTLAPPAHVAISTGAGDYVLDFEPLYADDPIADQTKVLAALPHGTIFAWYGSYAAIPSGWKPCDGNNGTPDLGARLPIGIKGNNDAQMGTPDGALNPTVAITGSTGQEDSGDKSAAADTQGTSRNPGGQVSNGNHTHSAGSLQTKSIPLPPVTYIYYIMKT